MKLPVYLDSSAIVKLYVRESGSTQTLKLTGSADLVACSDLGYVEVRAALAAAWRGQRLRDNDYADAVSLFRRDWVAYSTVSVDAALIERAAELAEGFGLRGYDSIHLASADRIRLSMPDLLFASFDLTLNRAAKLLAFALPDFVPFK